MLTIGSLFSGIGGIEYGLEQTWQFETIWNCEYDAESAKKFPPFGYAARVLAKHYPNIPNLGDIKKVRWEEVRTPDVLCGGFPCQDISVAGKGAGIKEGTRSGLWLEYAKAIRHLRPRYVLVENVSALTFRGLLNVLGDLAEIGYNAEWLTLSAAEVGAWHKRERIFIIAYPNGAPTEHALLTGRAEPSERDSVPHTTSKRCDDGGNIREGGQILQTEKWALAQNKQEGNGWLPRIGANDSIIPNTKLAGLEGRGKEHKFRQDSGKAQTGGSGQISNTNLSAPTRQRENGWKVHRLAESKRLNLRGCGGWWATEPNVGRVANGVPFRMDRLKCLGNAVVPQVAEVIGELILEMEGMR